VVIIQNSTNLVTSLRTEVQTAFMLYRLCCPQQFTFWLRTCSPRLTYDHAQKLDKVMEKAISIIGKLEQFKRKLSHVEKLTMVRRIFLAIRNGGCGIIQSAMTADPAYIGSVALTLNKIHQKCPSLFVQEEGITIFNIPSWTDYEDALVRICGTVDLDDADLNKLKLPSLLEETQLKIQHKLYYLLQKDLQTLVEQTLPAGAATFGFANNFQLSPDDRGKLFQHIANKDPKASAWLTANGMFPAQRMSDLTMQTALQIRLLLPIITEGYVCRCGELMDRFGEHALICPQVRSRVRPTMHSYLKQGIKSAITSAIRKNDTNYVMETEEPLMRRWFEEIAIENRQPFDNLTAEPVRTRADIIIKETEGEEKAKVVDVCITSALAQYNWIVDYWKGKIANAYAQRKLNGYKLSFNLNSDNADLVIFCIETNGCYGTGAVKFMEWLSNNLDHTNIETYYLHQQIAVSVVAARAEAIRVIANCIARPPNVPVPELEIRLNRGNEGTVTAHRDHNAKSKRNRH